MSMDYLVANKITKRYANHVALNDVSISVPEKSIFGLLGPNGAGKTTLIRIINQINGPDEGYILLDGKKLRPEDTEIIGYLPEERGLYKKMKVGEQALYLAQLKGLTKKEALIRLKFWFEKFDIGSWWHKKVEELSKGMAQKVQFIVTVIHEPKLLIFDEPFSGFDPINTNLLKEEILELRNKGATVIFSTHDMSSVEELCDNIALINKSKKILDGAVYDIKQNFKTNIFEIGLMNFNSSFLSEIPDNHEIISHEKSNGHIKFQIKINEESSPNMLVSNIMNYGTIQYFSELVPTMNEIFIKVVGDSNK